ncbi:portal protein [Vibrio phage vB_ValP_VA-RY-3]|nr:portal protein [Vibrio phage vB_ValP_VA-RY-3]
MAKEAMDNEQILAAVGRALSNSVGGDTNNDFISSNRRDALAAYLGEKGNVEEGKSSVVSTDVADAIEWIMPEVMKAFTQNNEVVTFDPVNADDTRQAEIESRYVYDTIMKDNNGFLVLHEFIKDALMQKNGFLKVFYDDSVETTREDYTGLTEIEYNILISEPDVEVTGLEIVEEDGIPPVYNVNITRTRDAGRTEIICVAPEDFRVARMHNSVSLEKCRFCAHMMLKTKGDLLDDGFDPAVVEELEPNDFEYSQQTLYRFSMQGEVVEPANIANEDDPLYEVAECYMYLDLDGDGVAEYVKVTVAGYDNPTHVLDVEPIDSNPFISATAILMSHKLFGLSIYDRLKEIQLQKTSLWRNILDNMYLQNNQRTVAIEGQVNLDDLLVSRAGGIIRAKTPNAVQPFTTPALPSDAYRMLDYLDQVRAGRAGVSPEGSVHDTAMGDGVGSQGLERLLSQKEELVGLMVRVFAETGIKPLCNKIRDILIRHRDVAEDYEFRGEWIKVTPSQWKARKRSTVRVGTGSGNRKEQAAAIGNILTMQEKVLQQPGQTLVTPKQVFNALNDLAKFSGMPGASAYFLDPNSPEGQENAKKVGQAQQQQQEQELAEKKLLAQTQERVAQAETVKAQAAQESVQAKMLVETQKQEHEAYKAQMEMQIKGLQQELAFAKEYGVQEKAKNDLDFRYFDAYNRYEIEHRRLDIQEDATGESKDGKREDSEAAD